MAQLSALRSHMNLYRERRDLPLDVVVPGLSRLSRVSQTVVAAWLLDGSLREDDPSAHALSAAVCKWLAERGQSPGEEGDALPATPSAVFHASSLREAAKPRGAALLGLDAPSPESFPSSEGPYATAMSEFQSSVAFSREMALSTPPGGPLWSLNSSPVSVLTPPLVKRKPVVLSSFRSRNVGAADDGGNDVASVLRDAARQCSLASMIFTPLAHSDAAAATSKELSSRAPPVVQLPAVPLSAPSLVTVPSIVVDERSTVPSSHAPRPLSKAAVLPLAGALSRGSSSSTAAVVTHAADAGVAMTLMQGHLHSNESTSLPSWRALQVLDVVPSDDDDPAYPVGGSGAAALQVDACWYITLRINITYRETLMRPAPAPAVAGGALLSPAIVPAPSAPGPTFRDWTLSGCVLFDVFRRDVTPLQYATAWLAAGSYPAAMAAPVANVIAGQLAAFASACVPQRGVIVRSLAAELTRAALAVSGCSSRVYADEHQQQRQYALRIPGLLSLYDRAVGVIVPASPTELRVWQQRQSGRATKGDSGAGHRPSGSGGLKRPHPQLSAAETEVSPPTRPAAAPRTAGESVSLTQLLFHAPARAADAAAGAAAAMSVGALPARPHGYAGIFLRRSGPALPLRGGTAAVSATTSSPLFGSTPPLVPLLHPLAIISEWLRAPTLSLRAHHLLQLESSGTMSCDRGGSSDGGGGVLTGAPSPVTSITVHFSVNELVAAVRAASADASTADTASTQMDSEEHVLPLFAPSSSAPFFSAPPSSSSSSSYSSSSSHPCSSTCVVIDLATLCREGTPDALLDRAVGSTLPALEMAEPALGVLSSPSAAAARKLVAGLVRMAIVDALNVFVAAVVACDFARLTAPAQASEDGLAAAAEVGGGSSSSDGVEEGRIVIGAGGTSLAGGVAKFPLTRLPGLPAHLRPLLSSTAMIVIPPEA